MITTEKFEELQEIVRNSKIDEQFYCCEHIAIISAPAVIIDVIVKKASLDSGVPMDWSYSGGRAFVYALGDAASVKAAKLRLWLCMPQHNLNDSQP